jgi:hypothetical protein
MIVAGGGQAPQIIGLVVLGQLVGPPPAVGSMVVVTSA